MTDIVKRTILHSIENMGAGNFAAVIRLLVMEGSAVLGSRTHRLTVSPEMDVGERIADLEQHFSGIEIPFPSELKGLGLVEEPQAVTYPLLDAKSESAIRAAADEYRTPEVMTALAARLESEAKAANDARAAEASAKAAEQKRFDDAVAAAVARMGK